MDDQCRTNRRQIVPYWITEICSYLTRGGLRGAIRLGANTVFLEKLGRVARHRIPALLGRTLPLQPVLSGLSERPAFLQLEFTNLCNANCVFCPYQYQERTRSMMPETVFQKAVGDYVEAGGGPVNLTPIVGDALIHPEFLRWVRHLRSLPSITEILLTTNGILLDKHGIDNVLDSGISSIIISTAGFDEAMYKRMYRSDAYDRMRTNIEALLKANLSRRHPLPIRIALRPDRPLYDVMKDPDFQPILALKPPLTFHFAFGAAGGHLLQDSRSLPQLISIQVKPTPHECCESLYRGPVVLSDGSVLACSCSPGPMDSKDLSLGHILENSLLELWTSNRMRGLRTSFERGCRPLTCQGCGQYEGLDLFRTPAGRKLARETRARFEVAQQGRRQGAASLFYTQTGD
jgi:MoaA/NifB/PqqE/SkfB family radical SAM enzyme